jgi:hypothetical protein
MKIINIDDTAYLVLKDIEQSRVEDIHTTKAKLGADTVVRDKSRTRLLFVEKIQEATIIEEN